MDEIDDNYNSFEEVILQNQTSSTETIYLHEGNLQNKLDIQQVRLPGQIDEETSSSSSTEFDVEIFRNVSKTPINKQRVPVEDIQNKSSYLKFLGINFEIAVLQERNKNPVLFLKCVSITTLLLTFLVFAIFGAGHNFKMLPTILSILQNIFLPLVFVYICKNSVKNGIEIKLIFVLLVVVVGLLYMAQFAYALLIHAPFNSTPLFILSAFLLFQTSNFLGALMIIPNFTSYDDPNYQQKYFAHRFFSAFFNTFGIMDASSDIVLGIQLIQYPSKKFLIIGIFLFILCNIDYIFVAKRIVSPQKVGLRDQILGIFVEVVVLVLTSVVLLDVSRKSEAQNQEDTFIVTFISLTTTIVNLLHNLFLFYYKVKSLKTKYADEIAMLVG